MGNLGAFRLETENRVNTAAATKIKLKASLTSVLQQSNCQ